MRYRRLSYRYTEVIKRVGPQGLGDVWNAQLSLTFTKAQWRPLADFFETPTALMVKAEVPGIAEEELVISVYQDVMVVEGIRHWTQPEEKAQFHALEIHYGPFRLEVPFAAEIDRDQIEARYDCGFLSIRLPKLEG